MRSSNLKEGIRNLLDGQGKGDYVQKLYDHPLISGLYRQGWFDRLVRRDGKPSYIPSRTFALALFDILDGTGKTARQVQTAVAGIGNEQIKKTLLPLMDGTEDLAAARANVEGWFNDAMERVSGWYKRKAQIIILLVALAVSVAFNVDTFEVTTTLWHDTAIRESIVAAAQQASQQPLSNDINVLKEQLNELPLPLGWETVPSGVVEWLTKIAGLLVTTLALSFGAPFWFGTLNRLVNIRNSGGSPATSDTEQS
jgi:hypothetical protein